MTEKYEICLRLNEKEKARLERDAKRCGLTRTAYLRRLIMGEQVRERPAEEIKLLRAEIHQIGNNINQIARSFIMGIANPEDAKNGLTMMEKVYDLMYQIGRK